MRLINTRSLELEEFIGPVPKYAILSHTWGQDEVTLQDWQRARSSGLGRWEALTLLAGLKPGQDPFTPAEPPFDGPVYKQCLSSLGLEDTRFGYWKILMSCGQARRDNLGYLWVDTNCIDKTSSAELSEAINSMFAWYRHSAVCYSYLVDVPASPGGAYDDPSAVDSRFRTSRWFTRGWTLQELLAPRDSVFFAADWTRLGTKSSLSRLLREVTSIPERYLLLKEAISGASLAQRMCWVSQRTTSRPEDIAYCMLGIFDVNMPLIYGEGSKAFIRLQEEIIKKSDDHSIFAWTWVAELTDPLMKGARVGGIKRTDKNKNMTLWDNLFPEHSTRPPRYPEARLKSLYENSLWGNPERSTILAPDPLNFFASGQAPVMAPTAELAPFTMTNAGLSISLPILAQGDGDLVFAVIDRRNDRHNNTQRLVCVPLVRHGTHRHRYTRTWFPRMPITIVRRLDYVAVIGGVFGFAIPELRTIQVCRDHQQVPFYYRSFGASSYARGLWLYYPFGLKGYRVVDGYATSGGVFNNYGIFFDGHYPDGADADADAECHPVDQTSRMAGGVLIFGRPSGGAKGRIAVFLGVRLIGHTGLAAKCMVARPGRGRLASVFKRPLDQKSFDAAFAAPEDWQSAPVAASCSHARVIVHNEAPMSQSVDSRIFLTEILLDPARDKDKF